MLFFPEGAIAILAVITAPIWAILLIQKGHTLAGIVWWVGAWSFGYLAYWSYRKGERGGIFIALFGILGLVWGIDKWLH